MASVLDNQQADLLSALPRRQDGDQRGLGTGRSLPFCEAPFWLRPERGFVFFGDSLPYHPTAYTEMVTWTTNNTNMTMVSAMWIVRHWASILRAIS